MLRLFVLCILSLSTLLNCQSKNDAGKSNSESTTDAEESQTPTESQDPTVVDLDVQSFMKSFHRAENAQLVDVRTPEEIAEGKVQGALEMDFYDDQFEAQIKTLDPSIPTYLYCRSGNRSGKAGKMLIDLGFKQVYNMDGGYDAFSEMQGQ